MTDDDRWGSSVNRGHFYVFLPLVTYRGVVVNNYKVIASSNLCLEFYALNLSIFFSAKYFCDWIELHDKKNRDDK